MAAGAKESVTRKKSFSVSVVAVLVVLTGENSCKSKMFSLSVRRVAGQKEKAACREKREANCTQV